MNTRLVIAILVYVVAEYFMGTLAPGARAQGYESALQQVILQSAVSLTLSGVIYYVLLPSDQRKGFSSPFILRLLLAFVSYVVVAYAVLLLPALFSFGAGNLIVRFVLQMLIMIVMPYLAPPVAFLAVLWLTAKDKRNVPRHFLSSVLTVASVAAVYYCVYLYVVVVNDRTGWSSLLAVPVFIFSSALFLIDGLVLLKAGFTTPEDRKLVRATYLISGTILTALVAGLIAWYIAVNMG